LKRELKHEKDGIIGGIKKWNKKRQINKFERNHSLFHPGARGELQALDVLSQLPDDYHIMCGVNFELPKYITYDGRKNLKSQEITNS